MHDSHHHGSQCCRGHGHEQGGHQECCGQTHEHSSSETCCGGHHEEHDCCGHAGIGGRLHRRFRSREERLARLEEYRKDLQEELKGVEERIVEIHSGT